MVARYGGSGPRILNPGPLLYILDAVEGSVFGQNLFDSVTEKACAVAHTITREHVFHDGNKRTGLEVLFILLEANGYTLLATDDEIVAVMGDVAAGDVSLSEFTDWVEGRLSEGAAPTD